MLLQDSFLIDADTKEVWSVFMDVEKLGNCVPGCSNLKALNPEEYEADMEVKTVFMKINFKANGKLKDATEGKELIVEMVGKPIKLAGLFKCTMKVQLEKMDHLKTKVNYIMDLRMSGRLASLGDVLMRGTVKSSGEEFAENVQKLFSKI